MSSPILNIDDAEFMKWGHAGNWPNMKPPESDRFQARLAQMGPRIGAQKLGCTYTVVPPGKTAFPFHSHRINEEMFFIIEGEGELRLGNVTYKLRQGDVIACPAGGPDTAHQISNKSQTAELRYLSISTMHSPEMTEYPDSGKFALLAMLGTGPDGKPQRFRFMARGGPGLEYWDGEK